MSEPDFSAEEIRASGYDFNQSAVAPDDFDPNAKAYVNAPAGDHIMEVDPDPNSYSLETGCECRVKDGPSVVLNKLWVRLRVCEGQPHAGATCLDFVAMPTPRILMPAWYANRWGNFLKALGFVLPAGRLAPPDFNLDQLLGRRALVSLRQQTDNDKQPKFRNDGEPMIGVKLFGYSAVPAPGTFQKYGSSCPAPPPLGAPPAPPFGAPPAPAPAAATADINL